MKYALVGIGLMLVVLAAGCGSKTRTSVGTVTHKTQTANLERSLRLDKQEFRCLHTAITTITMERCRFATVVRADRRIRVREKVISSLLFARSARAAFAKSERLWIRYREASCEAEASAYMGGSAQPLLRASCEVMRSKSHLKELAEFEAVFRQGGR